jgi:hypothetical protein
VVFGELDGREHGCGSHAASGGESRAREGEGVQNEARGECGALARL